MEAGKDKAERVASDGTGSEMTETPSVTESTPTIHGLADFVTGKILEAPKETIFNTLPSTTSATKTSRQAATIAITTRAPTTTTTIITTATATKAAIATKARNTVTTTWIPKTKTKTTLRTHSMLSTLPSEVAPTNLDISKEIVNGEFDKNVTETPKETTTTKAANTIVTQDLISETEEQKSGSSPLPDVAIFPEAFLTTQQGDVTEMPELVSTNPEVLTLQPDYLPDSTAGKVNDLIHQLDSAVFPQVAVTLKPLEVASEKPVENSRRTEETQPRSIQATNEQNILQLKPGKSPEAKIDSLWAVILGLPRPPCASGLVCGGACLERQQVCDSLQDCEDGRDEAQCGQLPDCREGEFHCLKGRCIPETWKCDGKPDCHHGEDEVACASLCAPGEFLCSEGRCVPGSRACDGTWDCGQGEDEAACTCSKNQFRCLYGGGCVGLSLRCDGGVDCPDGSDEHGCKEAKEPECGTFSLNDNTKRELAGEEQGQDTSLGWPTMALLFNVASLTSCTVSILSPSWLVTSNSCLANATTNPLEWVLFGGPGGNQPKKQDNMTQIRLVRTMVPHPLVKRTQHLVHHDLALVRLQDPLVFSSEVASVCLAEEELQEGQICVVTGWSGSDLGDSYRQYVSRLEEPLLDSQVCNSSSLYGGHLGQGMLCSGRQTGSSLCQEDSPGAPLMCLAAGSWRLQGVLSYTRGCGGAGRPHVFTDMVEHRGWILDTMGLE